MNETIDILIATYNGEKYLKEQLDSILGQTYENIRLIISDDYSKDRTREILKEYEQKDSRVKVHYQEQNLGYIRNFEYLLKQVENEIYMLSDQDDVWLENKVKKTLEALKNEKADLVFGDLEVVNQNLDVMYESFGDFMKLNGKIEKYINDKRLNYLYNCVTGCTIMSKKKFIEIILPIPYVSKYVAHDHWIALVLSLNGKVVYMKEKNILYRQHGNNEIGTQKISHKFEKLEEVRKLFLEVKLGIFKTYVENEKIFSEEMRNLNKKAYNYYIMLENKKNFNFKGWKIFHRLYKAEKIMYYIQNFIIMNLPFIGKGIFKIRYVILKFLGKR